MSDFVEKKLEDWGLSEYIEKFKGYYFIIFITVVQNNFLQLCCTSFYLDEQIDEQTILHMPESMIKEIIPIIEKRFCFLKNRKTLLEENENENFASVR